MVKIVWQESQRLIEKNWKGRKENWWNSMTDMPGSFRNDIQHLFVDEAGDPTLFANRRRAIVGTEGFHRGNKDAWTIEVTVPERHEPLQAVDYFLWALQRFYEPRRHPQTNEELHDERFLKMLWPQVDEIHDLHFGLSNGTVFNSTHPISLTERFGQVTKKKRS